MLHRNATSKEKYYKVKFKIWTSSKLQFLGSICDSFLHLVMSTYTNYQSLRPTTKLHETTFNNLWPKLRHIALMLFVLCNNLPE